MDPLRESIFQSPPEAAPPASDASSQEISSDEEAEAEAVEVVAPPPPPPAAADDSPVMNAVPPAPKRIADKPFVLEQYQADKDAWGFLGLVAFFRMIARKYIFPGHELKTPEEPGWNNIDYPHKNHGIKIRTADNEELEGVYFESSSSHLTENATIILFGGNGELYQNRDEEEIKRYLDKGMNVVIFNYRGYGRSTGTPDPVGVALDGEAALHWVKRKGVLDNKIVLSGWSLGGAVAAEVAGNHKDVNVICDRTFKSLHRAVHNWGGAALEWLLSIGTRGWDLRPSIALKVHAGKLAPGDERTMVGEIERRKLADAGSAGLGKRLIFTTTEDEVITELARMGNIKTGGRKLLENTTRLEADGGHQRNPADFQDNIDKFLDEVCTR